ncbi:MAG: hypothetical protein NTV61_11595 [Candidatus Bathyarchaeota archaeon]|nr:hypothetical protein [Candidatus Bathyarchaeota archaeon]
MMRKGGRRRGGRGLLLAAVAIASAVILLVITTPAASPPRRTVIILDTLPNTAQEDFPTRCRAILEPAGYEVEAYTGAEVTVERIKTLGNSPLIILRAHSSVFDEGVWFYTGEPYSNTEHVLEQLANELHIGRTSPTANLTFAVGSTYISKNLGGKLEGALVVLMGCDGIRRSDLARAFTDSGATAYVSWDGPVTIEQTDEATLELLRSLAEDGVPLKTSIEDAMRVSAQAGFNSTLALYPADAAGFTLHPD